MGGANSWRTVIDGDDWMRSQEKRLLHEERRASVGQASDVLGPGFDSTAVPLDDWSGPETIFNGLWWSAPGAANAPDSVNSFYGQTIMQSDGSGIEVAYSETNPPLLYVRDVTVDASGTRSWGSWAPIAGGGGGGGTPTGPAGGDLSGTYPNPILSPATKSALMVDVQDEGVGVVTDATTFNFVGTGVTATGAGSVATITIPTGGNATVVTSTTRPASPTSGQIIYETDTSLSYLFQGGEWRPVQATNVDFQAVRAASTVNVPSLSGLLNIDNISLVAGDRVLLKNQATRSQNGIWIVSAGAWTRATDADTGAEVARGRAVYVKNYPFVSGSQNLGKTFVSMIDVPTIGTDPQDWRVVDWVDSDGAFARPIAQGDGHQFFNKNARGLEIWDGLAWQLANGIWIATSSTRPGFPDSGNIVYETDTGLTYVYDGSTWQLIGAPNAATLIPVVSAFTSNGTWTKPANTVYVDVEVQAGGAAGGSTGAASTSQNARGGGGGAGGYVRKRYTASALGSTEAVVVGAGGTPVGGSTGNAGGASSFGTSGTLISANGGSGGLGMATNAASFGIGGGSGGSSSTAIQDLTFVGGNGDWSWGDAGLGASGAGAASYFGAGGLAVVTGSSGQSLAGGNGRAFGSGGAGGLATSGGAAALGGSGLGGIVIVTSWVNNTPAASAGTWVNYTPTVTAGTLGAGTITGRYTRIGNTIHWEARAVLGAGFSATGGWGISTPTTVSILGGGGTGYENLHVTYFSAGVATYQGTGIYGSTSAIGYVPGTNGLHVSVTASVPFTWKATDVVFMAGTYETT